MINDKLLMITLLYGQDTYRSRQELRNIIEEYKTANPDWLDFARIDCRDNNIEIFQEIRKTINTVSMFNQNKLIVLENIFSFKDQDELLEFLKKKEFKNIDIVFWDEESDKRTKLFKFLQKNSKEFKPLQGSQLKRWIKERIKAEDLAIDKLIEYVGSDLWRMENEINKLSSYSKIIKREDVELLVRPEIDLNIFNMVDALGQKNKNRALDLFKKYLEKGEDEMYLFSMFIYQIRNLIKAKSGGKLDMHPFVAQKSKQQAENFDWDDLKKIYSQLLTIDFDIKTGKTDIRTGLEMFLACLP